MRIVIASIVAVCLVACGGGGGGSTATCATESCCQVESDCTGGASCAPPGTPYGCGACNPMPGDCQDDSACDTAGTGRICAPINCSCDGQMACVAGCDSGGAACTEGTACDRDSQRCLALHCEAGCPASFECGDLGVCVRRRCTGDGDCTGGDACVLGECYASLGECRLPVP